VKRGEDRNQVEEEEAEEAEDKARATTVCVVGVKSLAI